MRVLITGISGFIGSSLADRLKAVGHEVHGVDILETGRAENFPAEPIDIVDRQEFYAFANVVRPELVIHCAASYKDPDLWHHDTDTNIAGSINVGAVARHHNARIFYFQTVLPPISSYAISKIAGEHYLRLSGQPLTVFRLAGIYGPRNLSGAIPTFYRQVKAGKICTVVEDATRDYVYISDLVERVLYHVYHPENMMSMISGETLQNSDVLDIRTGVETPIREIPGMIGEILGEHPLVNLIPRPPNDVPHYDMSGVPRVGVPFAEGLRRTLNWYEEHSVIDTYSHLTLA